MSLYRTYRPKTFKDVVGQDPLVSTLQHAVEQNTLSHAYLFSGTRGTGKTSVARILAKILLTRTIEDPVLRRKIEEAVDEGTIVDLLEIDAASNTSVDHMRDLIEKISFSPVVGSAKVYIIDEVHMLSKSAFNALLKTLEEPPPYAYFILATTELHKIPVTIQSRCQRYLFRQIREEDIVGRLRVIADAEGIQVEEDALATIAHHVQGGMRDAISLLDQLRSLPHIRAQDVRERVGETGHEYVEQIFGALEHSDRGALLAMVRRMEEAGVPLENFIRLMLSAVRQRIHQSVTEHRPTTQWERALTILLQAAKDLRIAPIPGLVVEAMLLSICPEHSTPSTPAPRETEATNDVTPEPQSPAPPAPPPLPLAGNAPSLEEIRRAWPAITDAIEPAFARMSLKNGRLEFVEGQTLVLSFSSAFHRDKANDPTGARNAELELERTFGLTLRLKCVLETELPPPAATAAQDTVDLAAAARDLF